MTSEIEIQVRPHVPPELIRKIVADCFGLKLDESAKIKELVSYDDINFVVQGTFLSNPSQNGSDCFILKIFNAFETANKSWLAEVNKAVSKCYMKCLPYFQIAAPVHQDGVGSAIVLYEIPITDESVITPSNFEDIISKTDVLVRKDNKIYAKHIIRLCSYIPGKVVDIPNTDSELLFDIGRCCGILSSQLKEIEQPLIEGRQNWRWNLICASKSLINPYVTKLDCDKKRKMIIKILSDYDDYVVPKLSELPKQWIHGDLNDQNLLHDDNKIVGIIDLDDMCYSYAVVDLATLLMYVGVMSEPEKCDENLRLVFDGFASVGAVTDLELSVLFKIMLVRYAQSCCISSYQYKYVDKGNEYLMHNSQNGWKVLEEMVEQGEDIFLAKLKKLTACNRDIE